MAPVSVFISYSSADRAEALAVRRLLVARGGTVWLDVFDIRVAEDLKRELGQGVGRADVFCLLLSPTAVASPWVAEEIARAREHEARGLRVVAVLLRPCRPPDPLLGRVMLDATTGIDAPDVAARLARVVFGADVVGDAEIDGALQEALAARQHEMEAALVLPALAAKLDAVRGTPIRRLEISFRHEALPRGTVLAVSLTFDPLFSRPMWFLFAHYREGHTWPRWMTTMRERERHEVRSDGKRVDGRFEWFDHVRELEPQFDATDLRDLPATFDLDFDGKAWRPGGSMVSYAGGPTVPHLEQVMEVPSLARLVEQRASFAVALLDSDERRQVSVGLEENDLDVRVIAKVDGLAMTLFRSAHGPVERAVLRGGFLQGRASAIEREAILGLYPRVRELEGAERTRRRQAAFALLDTSEDNLSPDERRVVGALRYERARLEMFRVFGAAPPPGPTREDLHRRALGECMAVCRILGPVALADPRLDDVGMTFWAASSLADYYLRGGAAERARPYAEAALELVEHAAGADPDEPEYRRWQAAGLARLAESQAASGDTAAALAGLDASVDVVRTLYEARPSEGRRRDLRAAIDAAMSASAAWTPMPSGARQRWTEIAERLE